MGALSSIPLCSRGREGEGDVDTNANRPEKLEVKEETIVVQPETANHQGDVEEKKSVEAQVEEKDDVDVVIASSEGNEKISVLDDGAEVCKEKETISSQKQDEDGNEEVSLDDETGEVDDDIPDIQDVEKPADLHNISELSSEEEAYRKTPTMLDTTSAITNMLSEIVMESDSREVVGR